MPDEVIDIFSGQSPEAVGRAMSDLSDLANFIYSVSENGSEPGKLADAIKVLLLIQEEEYTSGSGVLGATGLLNRFREKYGCEPQADPVRVLQTAHRLSLISRDYLVQLTTKGSRLLGAAHRVLLDWYRFHQMSELEQLIHQGQREMEFLDAYERHGYQAMSLLRALTFLEKGYRDLAERLSDYILSGAAMDKVESILQRYDLLEEAIRARQGEGFELTLQSVERIELVRAEALQAVYRSMEGVLQHATRRSISELSLINKARFYAWLAENFSANTLLDLAATAGDVLMPVYLPSYPAFSQLADSVLEVMGRELPPGEEKVLPAEATTSGEGNLEELEEEFDPGMVPYLEEVLAEVESCSPCPEAELELRSPWPDALMLAGAVGELASKGAVGARPGAGTEEGEDMLIQNALLLFRRAGGNRGPAQPPEEGMAG